ncbi:unnamed protein product, partial [Staurois parvus]
TDTSGHGETSPNATESCQRPTYYKRDILQETVRDCRHDRRDGQRMQTRYRRRLETADTYTGDGQRLQTHYSRRSETADTIQETVRDCRHDTGDGQRLQTQ